jgi:L-lactate dehydrogenase complex protein LldG
MLQTFRAKAQAVSAEVHQAPTRQAAVDFVVEFLKDAGVADSPRHGAVWAEGPLLEGVDRTALAARAPGLAFVATKATAEAALVGVSEVDFGVANTGTLAMAADRIELRLVSSLPPIHLAVVSADRIVPDLGALFARLSPAQSRYLSLITGPSRTADIERVLTIGVHGPGRLVIVVVGEQQGRN